MILMREGKRQCNARCYNAKHPKCRCICGGENHGKKEQATQEANRSMEEIKRIKGLFKPLDGCLEEMIKPTGIIAGRFSTMDFNMSLKEDV